MSRPHLAAFVLLLASSAAHAVPLTIDAQVVVAGGAGTPGHTICHHDTADCGDGVSASVTAAWYHDAAKAWHRSAVTISGTTLDAPQAGHAFDGATVEVGGLGALAHPAVSATWDWVARLTMPDGVVKTLTLRGATGKLAAASWSFNYTTSIDGYPLAKSFEYGGYLYQVAFEGFGTFENASPPSVPTSSHVFQEHEPVGDSRNVSAKAVFSTDTQAVLTADAGADRTVSPGETVSLTGSGRAPPYRAWWVQVGGPPVTLTGADTGTVSFVAPEVAGGGEVILEFHTAVTGLERSDRVAVRVLPCANADGDELCDLVDACPNLETPVVGGWLGPAADWALLGAGAVRVTGDVLGDSAAGGAFVGLAASLGTVAAEGSARLAISEVDGDLFAPSISLFRVTLRGDAYTLDPTDPDFPVDVPAAFDAVVRASGDLHTRTPNATTRLLRSGDRLVYGRDPELVVLRLTSAELAATSGWWVIVPPRATLLVDVTGTSAEMQVDSFSGVEPERVVFNFSEATSLRLLGSPVGTFLAPAGRVTQSDGTVTGAILAASLDVRGTIDGVPFDGDPCAGRRP